MPKTVTPRSAAAVHHTNDRLFRAFLILQGAPVLLFIGFLLASLFLSGGQTYPDDSPRWDVIVRYPALVIPAWLVVVLAAGAAIVLVPLVVTTRLSRVERLNAALSFSAGAMIADTAFAFAFPQADGVLPDPRTDSSSELDALGAHWIGAGLAAVCAVAVLVRLIPYGRRSDRLRRAALTTSTLIRMPVEEPVRFSLEIPAGWRYTEVAGERGTWRYAAPSALDPLVPSMEITVAHRRAHRRSTFAAEHPTVASSEWSQDTVGTLLTRRHPIPSRHDPRSGLNIEVTIADGDHLTRGACQELADRILESFRWTRDGAGVSAAERT